ncbi:hypothetical protein BDF20DRAFT_904054 [Mycotypha africana]|uniref:uncharacterized protein n=1 Tax=Mycotypha africana TaxID=64632 RepID=UPI002301D6E1|nr:uncharacterized protein BDF20DRAFT_904054 [Mycotypha africana]KAI8991350.1 hypothetical protein BDF20DRAFT_904054 [Mycotypha africana]
MVEANYLPKEDKIVCLTHSLEKCTDCKVDWTAQNKLASSVKLLKGHDLPKPNQPIPSVNPQVNQLKMEGNRAYKESKYEEAIKYYGLAVQVSWSRPLWEPLAFQFVREEVATILSNRSAAHAAMNNYVEALVDAQIVTRLKKDWSKGWFRNGKALLGLHRYEEAIKAFQTGLTYESQSEDLLNAIKEAQIALKA